MESEKVQEQDPAQAPQDSSHGQQESSNGVVAEKAEGNAKPEVNGQAATQEDKPNTPDQPGSAEKTTQPEEEKGGPKGGYDATTIPARPPGYTVKFTFHRAHNLPMADVNALSSDPYIEATLITGTPTRHKEDTPVKLRTPTVRKSIDPEWNFEWVVANVPSSGFKLKCRIYDEDPNDQDDRLGNVHINVESIDDQWQGIQEGVFEVKKRMGSKRAYLLQALVTCFNKEKHMSGDVVISVQVLGRTPEDGQSGRVYTIGPSWWTRHYSPLLGRIAHRKDSESDDQAPRQGGQQHEEKKVERYNFQANQIQLKGPVPAQLYHRYVEFKPWVRSMFTSSGIQGFLLGKALHHQHNRVYHFDRQTVRGQINESPSEEVTKKFLDLVHHDRGGRIFTYVLTLDALLRFTETGKEFGVDMLSKHTMHSDVSIYIAFSGEFFVRRVKHHHRPPPPDPTDLSTETSPQGDITSNNPEGDPPNDPSQYQLVIDNDSGTYRPNAQLLPVLKEFLGRSLPGLHVEVLDCQKDADKMAKLKDEQRERKKQEGQTIVYRQGSVGSSSISSSDVDSLDDRVRQFGDSAAAAHERGAMKALARDQKLKQQNKFAKAKREYGNIHMDNPAPDTLANGADDAQQPPANVDHGDPGKPS